MRPFAFIVASLLAFGPMPAALAKSTATGSLSPATTPIAMGCGSGRRRDASGHCRRRFNLFSHRRQFRAYKQQHCSKVRTPNGSVDRCKI